MSIKMTNKYEPNLNEKEFNKNKNSGKFSNTGPSYTIKPNPGLNLASLENIPKEIRNKLNFIPKENLRSSHSGYLQNINNSQNKTSTSAKEFNPYNETNQGRESHSKSQPKTPKLTASTASNLFKSSKTKMNSVIQSPTSSIQKYHRYERHHTDLDFNYLTNEKFLKDAITCGKERLSTVSLKSSSPDKYNFTSKQSPRRLRSATHVQDKNYSLPEDEYSNGMKKSTQGVLSDILDNQFSVSSPSRLKIYQREIDHLRNEEFKRNMMMNSRLIENELTISKNKIYHDDKDNNQMTVNLSFVGENPLERFLEGMESVLTYLDPIFERLSLEERVDKFTDCLDDSNRTIRLGSVVSLYLIFRKFQVEENLKMLVLEKTLSLLQDFESQEELLLVACLEVCSIFSPNELVLDNINLICMFLTDFNFPRLQKAAFNCLMSMEYIGIKTLIELASKDYQEYQRFILDNLVKTPHIQKIIIIRALLNEVFSTNVEKRHSALAALNRMYDLVGDFDSLSKLTKFFGESKIEKIFLSSTIRTSGSEGERVLLNELKTNKDFSVRVAIASVMSYRLPKSPKYLKIVLDNDDAYSLSKNLPGSFCTYYGKLSPVINEDNRRESLRNDLELEEDILLVSTRDFLASLQRMLTMNYDHSVPQIVHKGHAYLIDNLDLSESSSEVIAKNKDYFELYSKEQGNNQEMEILEDGKLLISEEVIKALCHCLKDYSTAVRDTAASSLGQIGLPEALLSIDQLVDSIKDQDVNVKSKVVWAIGVISAGCDNSVIPSVIETLKCNMWKVKSACLFTLSKFGFRCAKLALPILVKLLKESAINKQAIAETMIKLGNEGESTLLKIVNAENDSNYKLKSCIARALALTNVYSPNIDFAVECLFKLSKVNNSIIRKNALFAIRVLAEKADGKVTYLKRKNVIPFYYEMMSDKEPTIQAYAINCIISLGPQGELIFIEGLTKDLNPLIRQNSAVGLSQMGPHTLRTLLIGLHDDNFAVRKTVEDQIVNRFTVESIVDHFGREKSSQRMSLKIAIRDILEKDLPINQYTKKFFKHIFLAFERDNADDYYVKDLRDSTK